MGDWWKSRRMADPVRGTLQVTSASQCDSSATSANFTLHGVVSGDGLVPTPIQHSGMARTSKWPYPGEVLPVTVDRADPTRIRIEWDEVQTGAEQGLAQAQALAAAMGGGLADGAPAFPGADAVVADQSVVIDARDVPGLREDVFEIAANYANDPQRMQSEVLDALREHGVDVPGVAGVGAAAPAADDDPAERLRKLDALRDQGLITPDEHEAQRRRIIDAL